MFKFFKIFGTSNDDIVKEITDRGLFKAEDIKRDGNKMIVPTREEAEALIKADDDAKKKLADDEALKNAGDANNPAQSGSTQGDMPEETTKSFSNNDWAQDKQSLPNRYYVIRKKVKEIKEGKRIYEELPQFFVAGKWCEDEAGTVECSFYDNLRPEVIELYRSQGIIR